MTQQGIVVYYAQHANEQDSNILAIQQQTATEYAQDPAQNYKLLVSYTETISNKKTFAWPELQAAIANCKQFNAKLIIAKLGMLSSNEKFVSILAKSKIEFFCCDQPFVTATNMEVLCKHEKFRKQQHGNRIMQGLKRTSKRSGNPHAAKTINEVNKPKINAAIAFALLLKPIIKDYLGKGFSQRRMVQALNNEGFTAPEGGTWVLSQLQKVLDRIRLNDIASSTKNLLQEFQTRKLDYTQIAEELNNKAIAAMKRSGWNASQVKKLQERQQQLEEITTNSNFMLKLLPMAQQYRNQQINATTILASANQQQLERAAKQLTAYKKIINPHIQQIEMVMAKPNHNSVSSEQLKVQLGAPIVQIRQILDIMQEQDIGTIQDLHMLAYKKANAAKEQVVFEEVC
ncbi:MAG: hypothetical protein COB50_03090 [Thiotrichales bacterium]|nr:MAG: hypothetical protein COB50_03090 [Thiotrichales bacterium]